MHIFPFISSSQWTQSPGSAWGWAWVLPADDIHVQGELHVRGGPQNPETYPEMTVAGCRGHEACRHTTQGSLFSEGQASSFSH